MRTLWRTLRWVIVAVPVAFGVWFFLGTLRQTPGLHTMEVPFALWYGNWRAVLLATVLFTLFLVGFMQPRRSGEWRNAGMATAFFISLFTEMFGVPLTIYLIAPLFGLQPQLFGLSESHLAAFALDQLGLLPLHYGVYAIMVISAGFIATGLGLLAVGWATVYRCRGHLVTSGIYRHVRHPQYLGLILIVGAFNIQWPTLPTVVMAPVLIVMYVRLARREDLELATFFGEAFLEWAARTPAFVPWRPAGVDPRLRARIGITDREVAPAVQPGRVAGRRGVLAAVVTAAGAVGAGVWGWWLRDAGGDEYEVVARWRVAGGEGQFVVVPPDPDAGALHALGEHLRVQFSAHDNGVAMIFDDPQAARDVRHGSRIVGEERFRAALRHQRAMYRKQTARGEESLVIYGNYPTIHERLRYPTAWEASDGDPLPPGT